MASENHILQTVIAVGAGYTAAKFVSNAELIRAENYVKKNYEECVEDDILQLFALGTLNEKKCPFPGGDNWKKPNIFVRHKIVTLMLIMVLVSVIVFPFNMLQKGDSAKNILEITGMAVGMFMFVAMVGIALVLIRKFFRIGRKSYKEIYGEEGNQYWKIRENLRRQVAVGALDPANAAVKLMNTPLGYSVYAQYDAQGNYLGSKKTLDEWEADIAAYGALYSTPNYPTIDYPGVNYQ